MRNKGNIRLRWWHLLPMLAATFALVAVAVGGKALAGYPTAGLGSGPAYDFMATRGIAPVNPDPKAPTTRDAFLVFVPNGGGTCPAPPNGGMSQVGCTFVLDLYLNAGSNNPPAGS